MIVRRVLLLTAVIALGVVTSMTHQSATAKDESAAGKRLRHVVLFKFKDDVQPAQVQEVVDAFRALPKQIDGIEGFEWGTNISL